MGSQTVCTVETMEVRSSAESARARTFDALMDRPALDRAYRTARLILLDAGEAEDATHDAALAAWRQFGDLRDLEKFEAWFGRILINTCRDRLRARRRTPISIDTVQVRPLEPNAGPDFADAAADHDLLRHAFRTLSPEHREVIALRFYADLTVDQIAERTGARAGTVKSRLHHALRQLRSIVDANDDRRTAR
jgi:RNA polymerase sigma-70 factor (ECF subfamily)